MPTFVTISSEAGSARIERSPDRVADASLIPVRQAIAETIASVTGEGTTASGAARLSPAITDQTARRLVNTTINRLMSDRKPGDRRKLDAARQTMQVTDGAPGDRAAVLEYTSRGTGDGFDFDFDLPDLDDRAVQLVAVLAGLATILIAVSD
jgi:hypothetical protein